MCAQAELASIKKLSILFVRYDVSVVMATILTHYPTVGIAIKWYFSDQAFPLMLFLNNCFLKTQRMEMEMGGGNEAMKTKVM